MKTKTVSLNEEKRWKEYLADRQLGLSDDEDEEQQDPRRRGRRRTTADPVLREAEKIAADYYLLKNTSTKEKK